MENPSFSRMATAIRAGDDDAVERARLAELARRGGEAQRRKWHLSSIVPHWVPGDLCDDYADFAELYGEEVAARRISAMKAEAARC